MPFITEEIWQRLRERVKNAKGEISLMTSEWPRKVKEILDSKVIFLTETKYELIRLGRNLRSEYNIPPAKEVRYVLNSTVKATLDFMKQEEDNMKKLLKASQIETTEESSPKKTMPSAVTKDVTIYLALEGSIDIEKEKKRLQGKLESMEGDLKKTKKKLANQDFINNAPKHVIEKERFKKKELSEKKEKIKEILSYLK
jgi:valyl-tRNA synthetase